MLVPLYEIAVLVGARCAEIAIFHGPLVAADYILAQALGPARITHILAGRAGSSQARGAIGETRRQQPTGGPLADGEFALLRAQFSGCEHPMPPAAALLVYAQVPCDEATQYASSASTPFPTWKPALAYSISYVTGSPSCDGGSCLYTNAFGGTSEKADCMCTMSETYGCADVAWAGSDECWSTPSELKLGFTTALKVPTAVKVRR